MKTIKDFISETKFRDAIDDGGYNKNVHNLKYDEIFSHGKMPDETSPKGKLIKKEAELTYKASEIIGDYPSTEYDSFEKYYNDNKNVIFVGARWDSEKFIKAKIKDIEEFIRDNKK